MNTRTSELTPSQVRAVRLADPQTHEIGRGHHQKSVDALVNRGLAVRTDDDRVFLTDRGRWEWAKLTGQTFRPVEPLTTSVLDDLGFVTDSGMWDLLLGTPDGRRQEVRLAWEAVLGQRRSLLEGRDLVPALWEAQQPVRAVSLAMEAAGEQPAGRGEYGRWTRAGYRVDAGSSEDVARVSYMPRYTWQQVGHPERREPSRLATDYRQMLRQYKSSLLERGWSAEFRHPTLSSRPYLLVRPKLA
ncbi:hypothetical protein [Streptomyces albidoflavus]|uniref:hypothetical protein n=1 Tax=Streptomyces albidoflavus TaxID=1886 RepID=UPI0033F0A4BE